MELVSQELRPLSWPKFNKLLHSYLAHPEVGRRLGKYVDIDYLHELSYDEREFMCDFLKDWYRNYMDNYCRRSDVYSKYEKSSLGVGEGGRSIEDVIDRIQEEIPTKVVKMWDRKLIQSYTIRDYMPSKVFNENAIIDQIDNENKKRGLK